MSGVVSTNATSAINTCVLYQDVAIPASATTATFTFDIGVEDVGNNGNHAYKVAIYSTASVPGFNAVTFPTLVGPTVVAGVFPADVTLQSKTSGSFNISARAGQTVRFAILNAVQDQKTEVIGIDNVQLLVNVSTPTPVPTLSQWSLMGLALLLGGTGFHFLRHRTYPRASES